MASPARSLTPREEAGVLRDFYLVLWKQLDLRSGEAKWFDLAAATASDLESRAAEMLARIAELQAAPGLLSTATQDHQRLLNAVRGASALTNEAEGFKTYLRDRALEFAQQAAQLR
jgi:hypothetical protein